MRSFKYINPSSIQELETALGNGKSQVIAGGTDLLGLVKDNVLPSDLQFDTIVSLKNIPDLSYIKEEDGALKVGAATKLSEIANHDLVKEKYTALAEAAGKVASPHLRNMGTIGGNICQVNRCWYFRGIDNYFDCIRKGGNICYAMTGDNRFHSIYGATSGCLAVNPSDTAPALVALSASIVTNKRTIPADDFFAYNGVKSTILDDNEVVTEIQIPSPAIGEKSSFVKLAIRKSIDFPIVNCASCVTITDGIITAARICLNAVFNNPYRATSAEDAIIGNTLDDSIAATAGEAAVENAVPLPNGKNGYKKAIASALVKQSLLACK